MLAYPQVTHRISGNTLGATSFISSGTYNLVAGTNITLSQAANNVTIVGAGGGAGAGAVLSQFEPNALFNSTTTPASQGIITFMPFVAPQAASFCRLNAYVNFSFPNSSSHLVNGGTMANSLSIQKSYGLYAQGTGTNSSRLESVYSNSASLGISYDYRYTNAGGTASGSVSNSVAFGRIASVDSTGGITTSGTTYSASSSAAVTSVTVSAGVNLNGLRGAQYLVVPFATSITPGNYWMGVAGFTSQTTQSTSITGSISVEPARVMNSAVDGLNAWRYIANSNNLFNSSANMLGLGTYTVSITAFPATIAFTQITVSSNAATNQPFYFNLMNYTF